jgi:hypothetical protein
LKIADRVTAQVVPIHAVGAIHPMFKDVKLEAAIEGEAPVKVPQTLFERYVSTVDYCRNFSKFDTHT